MAVTEFTNISRFRPLLAAKSAAFPGVAWKKAGRRQGVTRQPLAHVSRWPRRETASKIVGFRRALDIQLRPWAFRDATHASKQGDDGVYLLP